MRKLALFMSLCLCVTSISLPTYGAQVNEASVSMNQVVQEEFADEVIPLETTENDPTQSVVLDTGTPGEELEAEISFAKKYYTYEQEGATVYPVGFVVKNLSTSEEYSLQSATLDGEDIKDALSLQPCPGQSDYKMIEGNLAGYVSDFEAHELSFTIEDNRGNTYIDSFTYQATNDTHTIYNDTPIKVSSLKPLQTFVITTPETMVEGVDTHPKSIKLVDATGKTVLSGNSYEYDVYTNYKASRNYFYNDYYISNLYRDLVTDNYYTYGAWVEFHPGRVIPAGDYDVVCTMSDGSVYTYKNLYQFRPNAYVFYSSDAAEKGFSTNQLGKYVSLYVYGLGVGKDTVKPVFYTENEGEKVDITSDVEAVETDEWGAYFRIKKINPLDEAWNISNTGAYNEQYYQVRMDQADEAYEVMDQRYSDRTRIFRKDVYYEEYDPKSQTFMALFNDAKVGSEATIRFMNGSEEIAPNATATITEYTNPLSGQKELKAVWNLTAEHEAVFDIYSAPTKIDYVLSNGLDDTFDETYDYASYKNKWRKTTVNSYLDASTQVFFYLPYYVGPVYQVQKASNVHSLTDVQLATLGNHKYRYLDHRIGEYSFTGDTPYRETSYFWGKYDGSDDDDDEINPIQTPTPVTPTNPTPGVTQGGNNSIGTQVSDANNQYQITENQAGSESVAFAGPATKTKKVIVPSSVVIDGKTYQVTEITANAFKKNKDVTSITIPASVKVIGAGAFEGCNNLTTVSIGKNVEKIGKNAFKNCKKLKKITITSTKLTAKSIGAGAFKKLGANIVIKVPKSKKAFYTKLLRSKGLSSKAKIK